MIEYIWLVLGVFVSIIGFLPFINSKHWFFRVFDFIRIQLATVLFLLFIVASFISNLNSLVFVGNIILMLSSFTTHVIKIAPYITIKKKKRKTLKNEIVALTVNVKQDNKEYKKLIELIKKVQPEIVLTLETDSNWENNLKTLESEYRTSIKVPKSNRYGMHMYTNLSIKYFEVNYLISEEYPSIKAKMISNNKEFVFWGVHPPPPSPTEKTTSKQKDAELLKLAKIIRETKTPTIVAGDFNNVSWSKTAKLFGKVSTLKDARIKRGLFPTFPANFKLFGFPIDLLYHSNAIEIGDIKTLEPIGSDHLPLLFSFGLRDTHKQSEKLSGSLKNLVEDTIIEGKIAAIDDKMEET